jgi:hypothetical protein
MTLECWDTKLWLFPKWTTPQCDPARMKGYQTLARFWVHHNVSTMKGRTNKQTQTAASKQASCSSRSIITIVTACATAPAGSVRLSPAIHCVVVNSARHCTPVRTHVVLA